MKEKLIELATLCFNNNNFYSNKNIHINSDNIYLKRVYYDTCYVQTSVDENNLKKNNYYNNKDYYKCYDMYNKKESISSYNISFKDGSPSLEISVDKDYEDIKITEINETIPIYKMVNRYYFFGKEYESIVGTIPIKSIIKEYKLIYTISAGTLSFEISEQEYKTLNDLYNTNKDKFRRMYDENKINQRIESLTQELY